MSEHWENAPWQLVEIDMMDTMDMMDMINLRMTKSCLVGDFAAEASPKFFKFCFDLYY